MSFQIPQGSPVQQDTLKEIFGSEIELINDENEPQSFSIKGEFKWGDVSYVVIQSEEMKAEEEVEFLRVVENEDEIELENIIDEDEWEAVSEAYDDLLFSKDERP